MKPGSKLKSTVCDTEVVVIRPGTGGTLTCGGAPMAAEPSGERGELNNAFAQGSKTGKRYVSSDQSLELLCVKAGAGSLALDGVLLGTKDAKPLPASD